MAVMASFGPPSLMVLTVPDLARSAAGVALDQQTRSVRLCTEELDHLGQVLVSSAMRVPNLAQARDHRSAQVNKARFARISPEAHAGAIMPGRSLRRPHIRGLARQGHSAAQHRYITL
jgi:hypothetical protein